MIKTPSGQYINPDDISCAYLELFPYKHKETGQLYKDFDLPVYMESQWFKGFAIEVTLRSQKDKLTASYAYESKEQAQNELDKMMGNVPTTDIISKEYLARHKLILKQMNEDCDKSKELQFYFTKWRVTIDNDSNKTEYYDNFDNAFKIFNEYQL